jgi:hypothetical protein
MLRRYTGHGLRHKVFDVRRGNEDFAAYVRRGNFAGKLLEELHLELLPFEQPYRIVGA